MRIKLDENLPFSLVSILTALGHEVHTVAQEHLSGSKDNELWQAAQRESLFLMTQDLDFSDIRRFTPGTHCGLLLVRLRSPDRASLIQRISQVFRTEDVSTWAGCFVVVSEHKLRVVRTAQ
jgi:predicted nuclease of predicted toxin-antitoxin system